MADAGARRESINELLARSNVKETLRSVQQADDDEMTDVPFWIKGKPEEQKPDVKPEQSKTDAEDKQTVHESKKKIPKGKASRLEKKRDIPRKPEDGKHEDDAGSKKSQSKSNPKDDTYWQVFLSKLDDRKQHPYTGKRTVIRMPSGIVNALQTAFGRRCSDILSILALEFFENEKDNIHANIRKRSNPNC